MLAVNGIMSMVTKHGIDSVKSMKSMWMMERSIITPTRNRALVVAAAGIIRNTGEKKSVMAYAKGIISTGKSRIYAKPLDHYIKLFTSWDEEKYYAGEPGDYIAVRDDDPHDIYIINSRFFDRLYKEV